MARTIRTMCNTWLGMKDKKALTEEYKEWIEASEGGNKQPHVLYLNQIKPKG